VQPLSALAWFVEGTQGRLTPRTNGCGRRRHHEALCARRSQKLAPHLVTGAPEDTHLMREEIFGPVLPLVTYRNADEAIAYVNARPRPLALYVFDNDRAFVDEVIARTVSGGVTVNAGGAASCAPNGNGVGDGWMIFVAPYGK